MPRLGRELTTPGFGIHRVLPFLHCAASEVNPFNDVNVFDYTTGMP